MHLLKLFIKHNQPLHTQYLIFMDDIVSLWMKMCDKFYKILLLLNKRVDICCVSMYL